MKRLIALVVVLMLCALPALAELWYTDDILEDGSPIYYFEDLSLTLPASWAGKVMAIEGENGTAFYQKASYEKYRAEGLDGGGFLFLLGASVNGSFSELPSFEYLGFSEKSMMNYYLELPTDYPAYMGDAAIRAEYDAMHADIDAVAASASFYPAGDTSEDEPDGTGGDEPAVEAEATPLQRARNHFEHSALPRYFYEVPDRMLSVLGTSGVYKLWQSLADENGVEYPYRAEDYRENWYAADDGATILQIIMPKPEATPLCYRAYMVYNPETGDTGYYTVEYDNFLGETAFLCGWTREMNHVNYGGAALLDADDGEALFAEARHVAKLAGVSAELFATEGTPVSGDEDEPAALSTICCPEQGFSFKADPSYDWDYQEGTGVTVYTEAGGRIPYLIVYKSEDLLAEPLEFIREQYTPHIQQKYADNLLDYTEYASYDVGGKQLPAGWYAYRVQDKVVEMLRLYDSTGDSTVVYTVKYVQDGGDEEPDGSRELNALDTAIRTFQADGCEME